MPVPSGAQNDKPGCVFRIYCEDISAKQFNIKTTFVIPSKTHKLSENSDFPLAPKLRFGSALAHETPFHIFLWRLWTSLLTKILKKEHLSNCFCIGDSVLPLHILLEQKRELEIEDLE